MIHETNPRTEMVSDLRFCGRSDRVAIAAVNRSLQVINPESGKSVLQFTRSLPGGSVMTVRPDGAHLATAHPQANRIMIRAADSGRILRELSGHGRQHHYLSYRADGRRFASSGSDRIVHVRDGTTYETAARFGPLRGSVGAVALNPDGSLVAIMDGSALALYDVGTGRKLLVLHGHRSGIQAAAFDPVRGRLVTGAGDGTIRFWRLDPSAWTPDVSALSVRLERESGLRLRGSIVEPAPTETHFTAVPPFRFLPSFERRRIIRVGE